jgi:NitT/TauT family transport system substrate-binding protein
MRHIVRAFGLFAAALALQPFASPPAAAADKVRFQTDWLPSGEHAMYYGAWQKGIFADEGIDVTITRGYGSGDTLTKLAGGAFDFGVADVASVLTARARQNVPVKSIAALYTQSPHSLFVLKSSGITSFKGLEGKKISITPGNSHKFYFPKVAEKSGTDPSKIVWVNMDGAAMAAQLIAKNIDAAPFYSIHHYYINKAAKAAGEEIIPLPFVEVGFKI